MQRPPRAPNEPSFQGFPRPDHDFLEVWAPFVINGRANGAHCRVLIDTGCNSLVMDTRFARRARLTTSNVTSTSIEFGDPAISRASTQTTTTSLFLWSDHGILTSLSSRTFLLAPLRVDVIQGTPLLGWFLKVCIAASPTKRAQLSFNLLDDTAFVATAQATNRGCTTPTCSASHM